MTAKISEMPAQFLGEVESPETRVLRQRIRDKHGKPVRPPQTAAWAPEAPADWRADKTARALGKVPKPNA